MTVPASFQLNQRRDTLLACGHAGIGLQDDDLLDEPTAALIDYIMSEGAERVVEAGKASQCVVFDFGGGTCDVSMLEITADKRTKQILLSQIAVSRQGSPLREANGIPADPVHSCPPPGRPGPGRPAAGGH